MPTAPASDRPHVDVVIPFAGSQDELEDLLARSAKLALRPGDSLTVVDNRAAGRAPAAVPAGLRLIEARELQSSYHARNRGASGAKGDWLVFVDADVVMPPELLERYFDQPPPERTAVLAGAVVDEPVDAARQRSAAARYAGLRARMTQGNTLGSDGWGYAQTANCAVRAAAFEQVGGFREEVRSGGDADLCFRLQRVGWSLDERRTAVVVHRSRRTLRAMLRQRARHGSGAAWLEREYPGSFPPRRGWLGLAKWTVQSLAGASLKAARGRSDEALLAAIDPLDIWAFELGRLFPNTVRARR